MKQASVHICTKGCNKTFTDAELRKSLNSRRGTITSHGQKISVDILSFCCPHCKQEYISAIDDKKTKKDKAVYSEYVKKVQRFVSTADFSLSATNKQYDRMLEKREELKVGIIKRENDLKEMYYNV